MNSAITTMGADDMIPDELANRLRTMKDEQKDIAKKKADELEDFLDSLNDKSYKETVNAINKKFAQNTKTN